MFGQAVGDALGTTVEFSDPWSIAARDGSDGWPGVIVGKGPFQVAAGQVTDDTELALSLARCLAHQGRYDDDAVARAYQAWRRSGPWDCGAATHQAFGASDELFALAQQAGVGSLSAYLRGRASKKTQANGSLMRSSPLGVYGHRLPRLELAQLAARDSTLSHPHEVCQAACAVYVTTLADAVANQLDGAALFERALAFAREHTLTQPIVDTLEAARAMPPVFDDERQGWVRIAFQYAFFSLLHAQDFEQGMTTVVLGGGDTDTNGAITGALLGARFGVEAIPLRWRDAVTGCVPDRPAAFHCNDLAALADQLVG
jgi:ADP-ribosylglycohydrolase